MKEKNSFASGNDFRMGTARVYAEHYLKMVLAMTNQKFASRLHAKWRQNGEDVRMQFADHVGCKCKWNDAARLGTKRGGLG